MLFSVLTSAFIISLTKKFNQHLIGRKFTQDPIYGLIESLSTQSKIERSSLDGITSALGEIKEDKALELIQNIQIVDIKVPNYISESEISTTYIHYSPSSSSAFNEPLVLLHGFDSSCLEYRRIASLLATDRDVYIPDILGWGFSNTVACSDFSPAAKLDHLKAFLTQRVGSKCIIVGASLGGAIAINLAVETCPELISKVVLIDGQGFIDGKGPSNLPTIFARLGLRVLKSEFLRKYANYIAYYDKKFSTDDAYRVGKLHCYMDTWEKSGISFLLSGGFTVSEKVPKVIQDCLVLWGRNDEILSAEYATRFENTLQKCELVWVEECGHVPHLEKPELTANVIKKFIMK
eukprot:gene14647-19678_t